jgi:pyruvate formate lyase activating enzyme
MGVKGRIHSVETFGTLDGPGVRYVLFLQGCALRCLYCHNPDTWEMNAGELKDSGELVNDIMSYRNFIRTGGVTISGGEPLLQPEFTLDIIERCRENGLHTALDTAGSVPLSVSKPVLDAVDLVLLDIKALREEDCIELTGRSNANTLATLDYCEKIGKPVWIRHVLVPGYTLDTRKLEELADHLASFSCIGMVELLPFHKMGEYKWKVLKLDYRLGETPEPTPLELTEARRIFTRKGIPVLMKGQVA